jgi:hypothetical protein
MNNITTDQEIENFARRIKAAASVAELETLYEEMCCLSKERCTTVLLDLRAYAIKRRDALAAEIVKRVVEMKRVAINVVMMSGQFDGTKTIELVFQRRGGASVINVYGSDQPGVAHAFELGFDIAAAGGTTEPRPNAFLWDPSLARDYELLPVEHRRFYQAVYEAAVESLMRRAKANGGDPIAYADVEYVPEWAESACVVERTEADERIRAEQRDKLIERSRRRQ